MSVHEACAAVTLDAGDDVRCTDVQLDESQTPGQCVRAGVAFRANEGWQRVEPGPRTAKQKPLGMSLFCARMCKVHP